MPRIYKSGKEFKGNKNSGTKTKYEFAAEVLNNGLANLIHNEELVKLKEKKERTLDEMRTLVTPITVKGITEKTQNTLLFPQPILSNIVSKKDENNKQGNIKCETENL